MRVIISAFNQELTLDYEEKFLAEQVMITNDPINFIRPTHRLLPYHLEQIAAKELGKQKEHLLVRSSHPTWPASVYILYEMSNISILYRSPMMVSK